MRTALLVLLIASPAFADSLPQDTWAIAAEKAKVEKARADELAELHWQITKLTQVVEKLAAQQEAVAASAAQAAKDAATARQEVAKAAKVVAPAPVVSQPVAPTYYYAPQPQYQYAAPSFGRGGCSGGTCH